jgi:DNA-binding transcriptional LysR family regulator
MELRQLRYFVRIVELGSMGRAAVDLGVVQSALSQQISRLEGELATRLLQRTGKGVVPTEAGLAFFREAQLTLRHAAQAALVAQHARLTGTVSIGLAPTTSAVLALPLMRAMRERYPDVRLHMVESLSGHLTGMLNSRQLDLAVLFHTQGAKRWSVTPLLEEKLLLMRARRHLSPREKAGTRPVTMQKLATVPLILPTGTLVIGGGNAALCAALMAREAGRQRAAAGSFAAGMARRQFAAHAQPALHARRAAGRAARGLSRRRVLAGPAEGHRRRHRRKAGPAGDPRFVDLPAWMRKHGVRFQPSLAGTLHLSRTNAFFMGGGKALVNAYYRSAEGAGRADPLRRAGRQARAARRPLRRRGARARRAHRGRACVLAPAASSRTAPGCARPGARTSAANGRPTTS